MRYIPFYLMLFLFSCNALEYHPYDVHVKRKGINAKNIALIEEQCAGKDTIRFVWMGDAQRAYDDLRDFVREINKREDIDFVMNGGDLADFGLNREFDWIEDQMEKLTVPYVSLVGNHDLLGNGNDVFKTMYGPFNYSFIAGHTKIICLNTNFLEFDYSEAVPDYSFMKEQLLDSLTREYHQTIVTMHAPPLGEQFDNNTADYFQYFVRSYKNILFCVHAHTHRNTIQEYFNDGIVYYGSANMLKRNYFIFTVSKNEYTYESIYF